MVFIRKLRPGDRAPVDADRISLSRVCDGRIAWTGSLDRNGNSVSRASSRNFETIQEAETDAIAWARLQGAFELQIDGPWSGA